MKALVNYSSTGGGVEIRDIDTPEVRPGAVKLRVRAVGVCGSDIHQWSGRVSYPVDYPVVLGHEFSGEIVETGAGVVDWAPGDRVVCETAAHICGKCSYCRTGNYHLCPERKGFGALINGAMAEYIVVREGILHRIPAEVSFTAASLTEAFTQIGTQFEKKNPDTDVTFNFDASSALEAVVSSFVSAGSRAGSGWFDLQSVGVIGLSCCSWSWGVGWAGGVSDGRPRWLRCDGGGVDLW